MEKVDMKVIYSGTLKSLKKVQPEHAIFNLSNKEQLEFMHLMLQGQGYYVKFGIIDKVPEIALPGLGTLIYNPLRTLANQIRNRYKNVLESFEINELIKEGLAEYYKTKGDPFHRARPIVHNFNFNIEHKVDE